MANRKLTTTLARLIPHSLEVKSGDETVVVAGNSEENRILNYFLAAKIRALLESNIAKYKDAETTLTPRELKDLADAGRSLSEFSATLYQQDVTLATPEQRVESTQDAPDFNKLNPIEVKAEEGVIR
jgi:hypothetical protein